MTANLPERNIWSSQSQFLTEGHVKTHDLSPFFYRIYENTSKGGLVLKGGATAQRLGGRGPFEVDYFRATPVGMISGGYTISPRGGRPVMNWYLNTIE